MIFNYKKEYKAIVSALEDINLSIQNISSEQKEFHNSSKHSTYKDIDENTNEMLNRFYKLFDLHNINKNEIPIVIDEKFNITLFDISTKENLLKKLTNELLVWLADFFYINIDWLLNKTEYMYTAHNFDKDIIGLCEFVNNLSKEHDFSINLLKTSELDNKVKYGSDDGQYIYPIIEVKSQIDNLQISKYILINYYMWSYPRTRLDLKVIIYLFYMGHVDYYRRRIYLSGYDIGETCNYYNFKKGQCSYFNLKKAHTLTWYPEDYVETEEASAVAKETDEYTVFINQLNHDKYLYYLEQRLDYYGTLYDSIEEGNTPGNDDKVTVIRDDGNIQHEIDKNPDKITIFTEGPTDIIHLEKAWKVLFNANHNFNFIDFNGLGKLVQQLKNAPDKLNQNISSTNPIISIFDADEAGISEFNKICEYKINQYIGKVKNTSNSYVILLPTPSTDRNANCEIEFLYSKSILDKYNILKPKNAQKIIKLLKDMNYSQISEVFGLLDEIDKFDSLEYFCIDANKKMQFANQISSDETLKKEDYENFKIIFTLIDEIINLNNKKQT